MVFPQDSAEEQENLLLPYKRQDIYSFTRTMKHKYMHVCLYANMPTQRPESVSATKHPCQACRWEKVDVYTCGLRFCLLSFYCL